MLIEAIRERWFELMLLAVRHRVDAADSLDELTAAYQGPGRHYHTLVHIGALLDLVQAQKSGFRDREAAELAIFYHDAIYDVARADNESASAVLARTHLQGLELPSQNWTPSPVCGTLRARA